MEPIQNRYDLVYLFDVTDGNPNGDPDAGNIPRLDPEDGRGLVTDVCLKRKVRNYVQALKGNKPPHEIYVQERAVLNAQHQRGYDATGNESRKKGKDSRKGIDEACAWMCENFYDIRTFGAVMTTEINAGQVLGPVQLTFARSVDRIVPAEHSITRMAVTKEADAEKERTIGRKATIPYGLYRGHGFINVPPAQKTGFSEEDLDLFWDALLNMFEIDRSAARGFMAPRALFVFKHDSSLGNAPAASLFDRVTARHVRKTPPRAFTDYEIHVNEQNMPKGVTVERKL